MPTVPTPRERPADHRDARIHRHVRADRAARADRCGDGNRRLSGLRPQLGFRTCGDAVRHRGGDRTRQSRSGCDSPLPADGWLCRRGGDVGRRLPPGAGVVRALARRACLFDDPRLRRLRRSVRLVGRDGGHDDRGRASRNAPARLPRVAVDRMYRCRRDARDPRTPLDHPGALWSTHGAIRHHAVCRGHHPERDRGCAAAGGDRRGRADRPQGRSGGSSR